MDCFKKLGISPDSNERAIKNAYRRLALQTHPDKVPAHLKEQANHAFRELYDAYEECLEHCCRPSSSESTSESSSTYSSSASGRSKSGSSTQRKRWKRHDRASDSDIRNAFNDVCNEMKKDLDDKINTNFDKCMKDVLATWPDKENCWRIAKEKLLLSGIVELADCVQSDCPKLSAFLIGRTREYRDQLSLEKSRKVKACIDRIHREWKIDGGAGLKTWVKSSDLLSWEWDDIISRLRNADAAGTIKTWRQEFRKECGLRQEKRIKKAADDIVKAYPDRNAMKSILLGFCSWQYKEIADLLPDEVRLKLFNQSNVLR